MKIVFGVWGLYSDGSNAMSPDSGVVGPFETYELAEAAQKGMSAGNTYGRIVILAMPGAEEASG